VSEFGFRMDHEERRRGRGRAAAWVVALMVLLLIAGVGVGLLTRPGAGGPGALARPAGEPVTVEVAGGASLTQIADSLVQAGVIDSAQGFIDLVDERGGSIPPGVYTLTAGVGPESALQEMLDPQSREASRVVVKEGQRLSQIVDEIAEATAIPESELRAALTRPEAIGLPAAAGGNPEGWLFPATYDVSSDSTATSLLRQMTTRFVKAANDLNLQQRAKKRGLTVEEVVIIASILEREVAPSDFTKASRVIANRLERGMRLQMDSTVNYALNTDKIQLSREDLATDSPYNTYVVTGLPPGPIASPGEAALEAALEPMAGDWLYFVATDPERGITEFTDSEEEFLRLKRKFQEATG